MTSLNGDVRTPGLTRVMRFALNQYMKSVNTSLPGLIETYDRGRRRADVRIAIPVVDTEGNQIDRGVVPNVPVVFPAGGGYSMTFPMRRDDPVLLVFCQRGIGGFKKAHAKAPPDGQGFFSQRDAVAIAGFGPVGLTPVSEDGLSIQNDDGTTSIVIDGDGLRIVTDGRASMQNEDGTTSISIDAEGIRLVTAGDVAIQGANVTTTETEQ